MKLSDNLGFLHEFRRFWKGISIITNTQIHNSLFLITKHHHQTVTRSINNQPLSTISIHEIVSITQQAKMHFSAVSMVSLAMMLLSVSARNVEKARSDTGSMTVDQASQQCGNDQTISCCNTSTDDSAAGGLLGANALNGLLGGSCTAIPVNGQFSCVREWKLNWNLTLSSHWRPGPNQPGLRRQPSCMLHWRPKRKPTNNTIPIDRY